MRKRSRTVALAILGSTAFALAGCRDEQTAAEAFPDEASCIASAQQGNLFYTESDCRVAFAQAAQDHLETAPRYESLELCEQEHGQGNCGGDPAQTAQGGGGGSIFMPLMMGYLLGQMMGGRGVASQPLARTADGRFATPGGTSVANNRGAGQMQPGAFNKAPTTMGQPPMTRAQVAQRGGFGQTATTRSTGSRSTGG
ncbi:MAG: DUF1190 domain-containing protein [Paracoccus sp. (in: a-proteobacteria)]|uniref:DUF1190 domain-containing protein n=1 Tax=Paracoccus sp. TaxID=267 RepID=UPI0026E049DF|nr:DUF1190 domain-containing protein [Paracoccus sp. (in: a-proteobacteria)]MDO5612042.1 DUF1190 domain-containing protein [Paracoccus sp. (in: a-proteobacteria)]